MPVSCIINMHRVPNVLPEFKFISANTTVPFYRVRNEASGCFRILGDLFSPYCKKHGIKAKGWE